MSALPSEMSDASAQAQVSVSTLPSLLPSSGYLISTLSDPDVDLQALPDILEKSPTIAARVVALANSAWSAPVSPVTSLSAACHRMGLNMIRTVGVAMAVSEPFHPSKASNFDPIRFWSSSLLAADCGRWLSEFLSAEEQQTARTASLLARLGLLWLIENRPEQSEAAITLRDNGAQQSLDAALQQTCGIGHVAVSQQLARHWQLPDILCNAIAGQKNAVFEPEHEPVTVMVAGATRMCHALSHQLDYSPDTCWLPLLKVNESQQLEAFEKLREAAPEKRSLAEAIAG